MIRELWLRTKRFAMLIPGMMIDLLDSAQRPMAIDDGSAKADKMIRLLPCA